MRRVRASVRLWQTELFITVIVVAILILSASLTQGLQRTLTDAGTASQLRNASALASQLSEQFPMTPSSLQRIRSQVSSYHTIYGDSVWVYATDGRIITSAVTATPPSDILEAARIQGLADNPPYSSMSLKGDGYVVAGKAIYQPSGERVGTVVVSGSVDAAMAVLEAVRSRLWVTFWVALIVAGALGFAFSEFIGRRIRGMSEAAASIAAGDFSQRLPTGWLPDEIHDLAISYNRMASKLGEAFTAVRQRESEIVAVVESLAEGVIAFDSAGTVRVINPGARRLLSDPDIDLTGAAASVITSDPAVLDAIAEALAGNAATAVTQLGPRTVLLHSTPLLDATDQASGAVLLLSDITEQKRLDDAQRRFVANASHEMRTPIAAIKGLLELLEDGAKDDPSVRDDFIGTMQLEVDRLGRLVADLLTLAQLEAGTFALEVEPESAESLLGRVCGVMRALAERAGVQLAVELPQGDLMVMADRDRIVQVLLGFADNALKHSKPGMRIELRARRSGTGAVLEVADQGPGIAPDDVERIFDRFYRVDEARSSRGAGLGLAIAKEIAEAHGTAVTVCETPGGGATFGLELPLAE